VGTELRIEQGALERQEVSRQPGTTLEVLGLFGRFPARRKFMRTRSSEANACLQVVLPLALAYPEISFQVILDGREALRTPGDGSPRSAAVAVLGSEAEQHLVAVQDQMEDEGQLLARVDGLAGTGSLHHSARTRLYLFVNRRPIQNRTLSFAIQEAYGSLIPTGRYPVVILNVEVPPGEVDFNVHPSKLEVKLLRDRAVYSAVTRAVKGALGAGDWGVSSWTDAPVMATQPPQPPLPLQSLRWEGPAPEGAAGEHTHSDGDDHLSGGERLEDLRVLGQVAHTYIVSEGDAGVYLVDQHAAHERVLLERLRDSLSGRVERQGLMEPVVVELPADLAGLDEGSLPEMARLGFEAELFGPRQLLVRAVPAVLANRAGARHLGEALTAVARNAHGLVMEPQSSWVERLALVLACKTAVKAGDALSEPEMRALLRQLGESQLSRTCAHGRPTAILLSHQHLEREFGRR
jgi:DNA mismatch repair protein MutL